MEVPVVIIQIIAMVLSVRQAAEHTVSISEVNSWKGKDRKEQILSTNLTTIRLDWFGK